MGKYTKLKEKLIECEKECQVKIKELEENISKK